MKIVCQSCGAKYSIADEKVAGKVFKIRCKKCSATIVVKGDQPDADQPTRVYDYGGGDAVWHAVVAGEQQGPFNPRQVGELLAEGKIDWEAYVWREGMENWLPAKDVEELVNAVMSESGDAGEAHAEPSTQTPVFGGTSDMGADPFAGADDGGLSSVLSQPAASAVAVSEGADLFGQSAAKSPFAAVAAAEAPIAGEASSPRVDAGMTGQRNENSVLFSLSNLQALATGSGSGGSATSARPGMAAGEGSGLIDIRALASATQAVADKSNGASRDKVEDLLAVGAGSTAFSAASFAAPVAAEKPDSSKMVLGAMGAAILVLGSAVAYLALREPAPLPVAVADAPAPAAQGQLAAAAPSADPGSSTAQAAAMPAPEAPPSAPSPADKEPAAASSGSDDDRSAKASADTPASTGRGDKKRGASAGGGGAAASKPEKEPAAAAEPAAAPSKPKAPASSDSSIDDLLSGALGGKAKPPAATSKPAAEALPATPSRDDVLSAMKSVAPQVSSCANGVTGVAQAKVMVAGPTGRVTSVDVSGAGSGGPTAACISKTVGKAKFPKFSQPTFSFTFPFKL
jgi:predicted Zn finger-like uncharacterized protein